LAILGNVSGPHVVLEMREVQAAARTLGLEAITSEIRRAEDIPPAFEALKGRAEALYVVNDSLVSSNRVGINTLALSGRLPTMHGFREYVEAGGLMSYGANFPDLFRRAADLVDKILRGAKPAPWCTGAEEGNLAPSPSPPPERAAAHDDRSWQCVRPLSSSICGDCRNRKLP
jgi:putative ABC transport system substrate-binding protein